MKIFDFSFFFIFIFIFISFQSIIASENDLIFDNDNDNFIEVNHSFETNDINSIEIKLKYFIHYIIEVSSFHPKSSSNQFYEKVLKSTYLYLRSKISLPNSLERFINTSNVIDPFTENPNNFSKILKPDERISVLRFLILQFLDENNNNNEILINDLLHRIDSNENISRVIQFMIRVASFIDNEKVRGSIQGNEDERLLVLVVGGGPVGLLNAIQAHSDGSKVIVTEKRSTYSRNLWFDILPAPQALTVPKLRQWGAFELDVQAEEEVHGSYVIRCQLLERFLARILSMIPDSQVELHYGLEFIHYCPSQSNQERATALFHKVSDQTMNKPNEILCHDHEAEREGIISLAYDLLVAAEGQSSKARDGAGISFELQETFSPIPPPNPGSKKKLYVPSLHQTTLLLPIKPDPETGACPEVQIDPETGKEISAWFPSKRFPEIPFIFKRFYSTYCSLQFLFTLEEGTKLLDRWTQAIPSNEEDKSLSAKTSLWRDRMTSTSKETEQLTLEGWQMNALPWDHLLEVINHIFVKPIANVEELIEMIPRKQGLGRGGQLDLNLFNVVIRGAEKSSNWILYEGEKVPIIEESEKIEDKKSHGNRRSLITVVGDAFVTAHYRLGVGINKAFSSLIDFSEKLIKPLNRLGSSSLIINKKSKTKISSILWKMNQSSKQRQKDIIQFMISTMYYETYCNFMIFFDFSVEKLAESQVIFIKSSGNSSDDQVYNWNQELIGQELEEALSKNCIDYTF